MATVVLQTRVDTETKLEAESLFDSLGLDITTAIRLFLRQSINQQRIPFDIVPPCFSLVFQTVGCELMSTQCIIRICKFQNV